MSINRIEIVNDTFTVITELISGTELVNLLAPYEEKLRGVELDVEKFTKFKKAWSLSLDLGSKAFRSILLSFYGSPDNQWFADQREKVEEQGFGFVNSEIYFPVNESLAECVPLINLYVCLGMLDIKVNHTSTPAKFTSNNQFEREFTLVTRWLLKTVSNASCSKLKGYNREKPVSSQVNVLKSLILRKKFIDDNSYTFVKTIVKDLCGETKSHENLGMSFVLQSVPRDLKNFIRKVLNVIIAKMDLTIPGSYYKSVSECLPWQVKVTKRNNVEVSKKIKPHTSSSIRYFPNDLRGVRDQLMPLTANFRSWLEANQNDSCTSELLTEGTNLLSLSYSEFFTERRHFRESFYSYCQINGKNIDEYEETYVSSSHFYRSTINENCKWYASTLMIGAQEQPTANE